MKCRVFWSCAAALAGALFVTATAQAQQGYPNKPIRMLVPFAAGGGTDNMARVLAQRMSESMGQPVVVDNRPGSDTSVAAAVLAKAPPDGYTTFLTLDITFTMNPFVYATLPYDPKELAPVSLVGISDLIMVARAGLPPNNLKEVVAYAKANPGKLNYGSGAVVAQMTVEMLKQQTGIEMVYVPFKGAGPTTQALLSGDIDLAIADFFSFLPHIKSGKLKAIATTGRQRDPSLPDTPTMIESGFPAMEVIDWWGVYVPAGTPAPIVERLNREIVNAVRTRDFSERMRAMVITAEASTPAELAARQARDAARWAPVIKASGVRIQ
jgi:tripartite-type tricarboxylate transporter receptor subunit TctC